MSDTNFTNIISLINQSIILADSIADLNFKSQMSGRLNAIIFSINQFETAENKKSKVITQQSNTVQAIKPCKGCKRSPSKTV